MSSAATGIRAVATGACGRAVTRFGSALLTAITLLLAQPGSATAQGIDGDLRIGAYTDVNESFVGAGLLIRLDGRSQWFFNPNLEYVFVDRGDLVTINADFHYDLASEGMADFWLGAGPALVMRDNGRGSDETDLGVNVFGGVGLLRGNAVRPFIQAKLLLSDETEGVVAFGIRF